MKAIFMIKKKQEDQTIEEPLLFDTEKSEKICDCRNSFGYIVKELYLSPKGIIFERKMMDEKLEIPDQEEIKKYIGENYPDVYIKFFGQVEEA
ncbi:MAG: hypothetical protein HFH41_04020 [Lachnospiraceae bacterium]|nr:hypothetical protein [Lachnospiraceae bacterium]